MTAIGIALVFSGITFVLWLGAHQMVAGTLTGGQLLQFLLYAGFVGSSAAALTEIWGEIQVHRGALHGEEKTVKAAELETLLATGRLRVMRLCLSTGP